MIVLEFKAKGKTTQYTAIDEAIRTAQFVRNKCIRYWMDNRGVGQKKLYRYNTALRAEFPFVKTLNSHACQASVERAYSSIARFYDNCQRQVPGQKGYPQFKKNCRSVEYKTSGWSLSETRKQIVFTDKKAIGKLRLKGRWDLNFYQIDQIKRVRLVKRADGYYVQFVIRIEHQVETNSTGRTIGLYQFFMKLHRIRSPLTPLKKGGTRVQSFVPLAFGGCEGDRNMCNFTLNWY